MSQFIDRDKPTFGVGYVEFPVFSTAAHQIIGYAREMVRASVFPQMDRTPSLGSPDETRKNYFEWQNCKGPRHGMDCSCRPSSSEE